MNVHPIHNQSDYDTAPAEIDRLFAAPAGCVEAEMLDIPTTLVEACEARVHAVNAPDPVAAHGVLHGEPRPKQK
jgi:HTH-type transcriptional regulator/antitoxin HigA